MTCAAASTTPRTTASSPRSSTAGSSGRGLGIHRVAVIGLCAESHCTSHAAISCPDVVQAGLRVGHIGNSAARNEIGRLLEDLDLAAAEGWFAHVFVTDDELSSCLTPEDLRSSLARLPVTGRAH